MVASSLNPEARKQPGRAGRMGNTPAGKRGDVEDNPWTCGGYYGRERDSVCLTV